MNYKYFKFDLPTYSLNDVDDKNLKSTNKIFSFIYNLLPKSNPHFDQVYDNVETWLIEFDDNLEATREIGLDRNDSIIAFGPYKTNRGFWTDSALKYQDIENCFRRKETISLENFENTWKKISKI